MFFDENKYIKIFNFLRNNQKDILFNIFHFFKTIQKLNIFYIKVKSFFSL